MGHVHSDFTLAPSLIKIFNQLYQRKIPFSYLEEGPSDQDLKMAKQSTLNGIKQNQIFKKLAPEISNYYVNEQGVPPYLKQASFRPISTIIENKIIPLLNMGSSQGFIDQITLEIFRDNAYQEEIKLYDLLLQLNIPYAGIDFPTDTYNDLLIKSSESEENYCQNETPRIKTMLSNTLKRWDDLTDGGIMFIPLGGNHSHRLAANILNEYQTNSDLNEKYNLQLHAVNLYSTYANEFDDNYASKFINSLDSNEIKEIYKTLPCESKNIEKDEEGFHIPYLEEIVNNFVHGYLKINNENLSTFSIFKMSPHDKLLKELKTPLNLHSVEVKNKILKIVDEEKNYSLALRQFCALGDLNLVKILIKYSSSLPIDFNEKSSNGKTPLAWVEGSKANQATKNQIKILLEEKMQSRNEVIMENI